MTPDWIDLSPRWARIESLARARNEQKRGYESAQYFNGVDTNFIGLCGENLVSIVTGLPINEELLVDGDGGKDFPFTNTKATQYWHDPWLKEFQNPKHKLAFYILAAVDLEQRRGWLPGFATGRALFAAPLLDWGYGARHSLRWDDPAIVPMRHYGLAVAKHREAVDGSRLW